MNENNLGRFCTPMKLIKEKPDLAAKVLGALNFVPVRAEIVDFGQYIEYIGMSDKFREIGEDEVAPFYRVILTEKPEGEIEIRVNEG